MLGRSRPGIRYGLGKRRYREIARCGPRDDCGEHSGWGKRERRQQANVSFHLALVLRDLGERLNATRYEIVDPSPCFADRQQDGVACLRFQHRLAARLMQNPFHGNEGRRIPRHGDDRCRRDCGILVTITRVRRCGRPLCLGCLDGTWFSQVDFDRFWTDDDAFDEPGDRLAIGDVAVTFVRKLWRTTSTTVASTWAAGTRATPPASSLRRCRRAWDHNSDSERGPCLNGSASSGCRDRRKFAPSEWRGGPRAGHALFWRICPTGRGRGQQVPGGERGDCP